MASSKNYLVEENNRNKKWRKVYADVLHTAFGNCAVIGHHVCFTDDDGELNEIPSADALMFDHDIMLKVFGTKAMAVMTQLAITPVDHDARDVLFEKLYRTKDIV